MCDFILKDGFVTGVRSSDDYHFHSFYEIHYVVRGRMHLVIDDRDVYLKAGDVCVIPPKQIHYVYADEASHRVGFRFSFAHSKKVAEGTYWEKFQRAFGQLQSVCVLRDSPLFQQCLLASAQAIADNAPAYVADELLFLAIDRLIASAPEEENIPTTLSDSLLSECIEEYLNSHYRGTPMLGELAASLNLSQRQTQRVIGRLFGVSFSNLLTSKRLTVARFLLRTTTLSVDEIAHMAGFCDKHYFYRKFRTEFGITPVQYRNRKPEEGS